MGSFLSTRLVRVYKEAGRPLPKFSDDDVLDYMVTEAIIAKNLEEERKAQDKAEVERERQKFKDDDGLQGRVDRALAAG